MQKGIRSSCASALATAAIGFALLSTTGANATLIAHTSFDTGFEGWTSTTPLEVSQISSGGATGGFMRHEDASGDATDILAPSSFLGNLSSLNGVGMLSYFHRIFETGGAANRVLPYEVVIQGTGGRARWTGANPGGVTDWTPVYVPFVVSAWDVEVGNWEDILANVGALTIRLEHVDNNVSGRDLSGIDDISLYTVSSVSAPTSISLALIAMFVLLASKRRNTAPVAA